MPIPELTTMDVSTEVLMEASSRRLFFGHMSVGENVLTGVRAWYADSSVRGPAIVDLRSSSPVPQLPGRGGLIVHTLIGRNRDPNGKLANFATALRGGLAEQVDLAMLKFCYVDVLWDTDIGRLFADYRQTVDALQSDYPGVTFVHATVPLTTPPSTIKQRVKSMIGRDNNSARAKYNDMLREVFGHDHTFDLAAAEAGTLEGAAPGAALIPQYTDDGAHLNAIGSAAAAAALLRILAHCSPTR